MALIETRVCDLTGDADAKVVRFGVDDQAWEIDLCEVGSKQLFEALRPFTDVARPVNSDAAAPVLASEPGDPGPTVVGTETVKRGSGLPAPALTTEERRACRAWAQKFPRKAGGEVGRTGALPAAVVDRWIVAGRPFLS